ncbi:hypothetical protein EHM76_03105 [bacterium]|nr:MAG: hypothetical protein EHM76_03105 [bacterium]
MDQQGRVSQILAVLEKLLVSRVERGVLALVLDGEMALVPHIGVTLPAGSRLDPGIKAEKLARRVFFGGFGMSYNIGETLGETARTLGFGWSTCVPLLDSDNPRLLDS